MELNPSDHWSNFNRLKAFQITLFKVSKICPNGFKLQKICSNSTKKVSRLDPQKKLSNRRIIESNLNWTQTKRFGLGFNHEQVGFGLNNCQTKYVGLGLGWTQNQSNPTYVQPYTNLVISYFWSLYTHIYCRYDFYIFLIL